MSISQRKIYSFAVHVASWIPLLTLAVDWFTNQLSANPIQEVEQRTGQYAIIWLMLTLAITPIFILTRLRIVLTFRRTLGLYAFGYALFHFLIFLILDYGLKISLIVNDLLFKPFILVGLAALSILAVLAATSNRSSIRNLKKGWKRLHRFIYLAAILAAIHYIWAVKLDIRQPVLYLVLIAILLILRLPPIRRWIIRERPFNKNAARDRVNE